MEGGPIISHRDEFLYPNKAAMTGLVFFAPWASARGVFLLLIFERKGVFLFRVSEMSAFFLGPPKSPNIKAVCFIVWAPTARF